MRLREWILLLPSRCSGSRGQGLWRTGTPWAAFFAMGALNNLVPFNLIFWRQTHIAFWALRRFRQPRGK